MNGYFQLEVKEKGLYMKFIPPTENGSHFTMADATAYLDFHNITGYNTVEMKRLLDRKMKAELFLSGVTPIPSSEEVFVTVSADKMRAEAVFYPPFVGGALLDKKGIMSSLEAKGVTVGIKEDVIEQFLKNREYCTPMLIAEGKEPGLGQDAKIEYFFDTNLRARPQLNEDGSVDFHKLNSISHVAKGTVLATLTPEKKGAPGMNVLGGPIPPRDVKKQKLNFGNNISYTEDKLSIVSDVDGHVSLIDGKVFVSDTYEVVADVDTSTGDIEYNGNIEVKGVVRSGFTLKASGTISVDGVVEGATLIADGDIILKRGIQGMGKGTLNAKGNIVTKFIENAIVSSGGNITAEAILHSTVSAKDSILVTGKKGFVTGGKVAAYSKIDAKTIGSTMGAETLISVGIDPAEKERGQEIQKEMTQLQKDMKRLEPVVKKLLIAQKTGVAAPNMDQMKKLVAQYQVDKAKFDELENELYEIFDKEEVCKDAKIYVRGKIYPGVKIVISDCMYMVKEVAQFCYFKKDRAEIIRGTL